MLVKSALWGSTLPKIRILQKKVVDKSSSESNFVQKILRAHISISPRSGARGFKDLPFALHLKNHKSLVPPSLRTFLCEIQRFYQPCDVTT